VRGGSGQLAGARPPEVGGMRVEPDCTPPEHGVTCCARRLVEHLAGGMLGQGMRGWLLTDRCTPVAPRRHGSICREPVLAHGKLVETPHHPGLSVEPIATFLPDVLDAHTFDEDTVLVGHSGGAALLLAILEHIDVTVAQAVLVGGYSTNPNPGPEPVLQDSYD